MALGESATGQLTYRIQSVVLLRGVSIMPEVGSLF